MKTIFTLTTIVMIVIASIVSVLLFQHGRYDASALLFITTYVAAAFWITVLSSKKIVLS